MNKGDLLELAQSLGLNVSRSLTKARIRGLIADHAPDRVVDTSSALELGDRETQPQSEQSTYEFELRKRQIELEALKLQLQIETQLTERERLKSCNPTNGTPTHIASGFDLNKYIRLVPPFKETDIDNYFQHFEKVAQTLQWPRAIWPILLQSVLCGKAQETFVALSLEESSCYEVLKEKILKTYEMVPEAYRQQFRQLRKADNQTYVELAHRKATLFDRWCKAKSATNFEALRELMLIEELKRRLPESVRSYVEDRDPTDYRSWATLADEYAISHKAQNYRDTRQTARNPQAESLQPLAENSHPREPTRPIATDSNVRAKPAPDTRFRKETRITCHYCKKPGHIMSECRKLQEKRGQANQADVNHFSKEENSKSPDTIFAPFISKGLVKLATDDSHTSVTILRDTGGATSLITRSCLAFNQNSDTGKTISIAGIGKGCEKLPLHKVILESDLVSGTVELGVRDELPAGISILLGNDLAGSKVFSADKLPLSSQNADSPVNPVEPCCVTTRAQAGKLLAEESEIPSLNSDDKRQSLAEAQRNDPEMAKLFELATSKEAASQDKPYGYHIRNDVLMRRWRPPTVSAAEEWATLDQIVTPRAYRAEILKLAHEIPMAGHLGINKTFQKVTKHFYWPGVRKEVANFCKTCHTCQIVGKPNQKPPVAPLKPIPVAAEAFTRIIIDCVGPLPKTRSGNEYLLTIMCASTRFPEAIPLRRITAVHIVDALTKFFTFVGIPKEIQSDQGSNFMSGLFQQVVDLLGARQIRASAYHPESQGALENFHRTLKNMMRTYCIENEKDWDKGIPFLLFAARDAIQDSLGFSPFELIFGHQVRGPLKLLKENLLNEKAEGLNLLEYVTSFRARLAETARFAQENLKTSQEKMKRLYDIKAKSRTFHVGDKVLVLLPTLKEPLRARYHGPYPIVKRVNELNYIVSTPDRRKATQTCHINMLKEYFTRPEPTAEQVLVIEAEGEPKESASFSNQQVRLKNSEILADSESLTGHLPSHEKETLQKLLKENESLFPDVPRRATATEHDVELTSNSVIRQRPYRVSPNKKEIIRNEVQFMLENDIIEPSNSPWASPVVLVKKSDDSYRFCTDYRKVNDITRADSFPMPRIEDCIDAIGNSRYISKCDLLRGYWGVPLTPKAREISAFVTPDGLYQYKVMPFGMRNSQATFQRMMNSCLRDLEGVAVYVDDIVIFSDTWEQHLKHLTALFERLESAKLTVNLAKSVFGRATITYLGHEIGDGKVKPVDDKVMSILEYPAPTDKKAVMRFLGMLGYYRRFCPNLATIACPLTALLQKQTKFQWTEECQTAFETLKSLLCESPVLSSPNFQEPFELMVDASDKGAGAVLMQTKGTLRHPVAYFSKKFNKYEINYSTIEKEALALLWALRHFEVYITTASTSTLVYTDHNPLTFVNRMKNHNRRLLSWSILLQEFDVKIAHVKGKDNVWADALSRA